MKKLVTILTVLLFTTSLMQAQALKDSWSLGFGYSSYQLTSTGVMIRAFKSHGGYLSLQRNLTEHSGLRLALDFGSITNSEPGSKGYLANDITTTSFAGRLDYVYNFMPCETLTPFATVGVGLNYYSVDMYAGAKDPDADIALEIGASVGMLANLSDNWKLKAELGSYQLASTTFDGIGGTEGYGLLGANLDAFAKFDIGVEWYFSKGEASKICALYDGLEMPDPVDYERLENIVKKYIPREVVKEVVVEKEVPAKGGNNNMVLMGVNYAFNSNRLKPESYPILYHAAKVLKQNPDLKVEVQGYTDNIGSEKANKVLSQRRADSVKKYLQARGISASRIRAVGYGESNPVGDNRDAAGRAMNRRIEFKVID